MSATIVVPVFNAVDCVKRLVPALIETIASDTPVWLIDDASTEAEIGVYFQELAAQQRPNWKITRLDENRGFVGVCNLAMESTSDDLILLNSDTIPAPGWYDALTQASKTDRVATVTPWSNNAEICSFPRFCEAVAIPEDLTRMARACAAHTPQYPELPTGVGFCLLITRNAIEAVGTFDAETFGRGYGEENDFCRRCADAGFRNILCDNAYVAHEGNQSFGQIGMSAGGDNLVKLTNKHPDYEAIVADFIKADPLKPLRAKIAVAYAKLGDSDESLDSPVSAELAFTGERFTPECVREIWYEHWHRYAWIAPLVAGKRVLDMACGEGYGSALLARYAHSVTGVDISRDAIGHAEQKYAADNVRFLCADCTDVPLDSHQFDVVVSFETLEHIHEQRALLRECRRLLIDNGWMALSTPDKKIYSDDKGFDNTFHVKELYKEEFLELCRTAFRHQRVFGQRLFFQSYIWDEAQDEKSKTGIQHICMEDSKAHYGIVPLQSPVYHIALLSDSESALSEIDVTHSAFWDAQESVYEHYNHEIRKNIEAGTLLKEMESALESKQLEIERLRAKNQRPWWKKWV